MHLTFTITRTDFRNYVLHHNLIINFRKRLFSLLLIFILFYLYVNFRNRNFDGLIFSLVMLGMGIFYFFAFYISAQLSARKLRADSPYLGKKTIIFNEKGITCSDQHGAAEMNYNAFQKFYESKNYFYLYLEFNQAIAIPKRAFTSIEQLNEFIHVLNTKIKSK